MDKLKYIGPDYDPFCRLHAYGREIAPKAWTAEEQQQWFKIEPRYKAFFEQPKEAKEKETTESPKK